MTYDVRYTSEALKDLDRIWDDIDELSKDADTADKYISELMDKVTAKKEFPFSGAQLEYRGLFTGFYSVGYKGYRAFYRIRDNYIEVIRIIMAKRDFMKILFKGDNQ